MKLGAIAAIVLLTACSNENDSKAQPGTVSLRLIQTSDIHSNVLGMTTTRTRKTASSASPVPPC